MFLCVFRFCMILQARVPTYDTIFGDVRLAIWLGLANVHTFVLYVNPVWSKDIDRDKVNKYNSTNPPVFWIHHFVSAIFFYPAFFLIRHLFFPPFFCIPHLSISAIFNRHLLYPPSFIIHSFSLSNIFLYTAFFFINHLSFSVIFQLPSFFNRHISLSAIFYQPTFFISKFLYPPSLFICHFSLFDIFYKPSFFFRRIFLFANLSLSALYSLFFIRHHIL